VLLVIGRFDVIRPRSRAGTWKLNLEDGRPERIRLRGRDVVACPEIVGDPGEVERLLGVMTAADPMAGRFVAIPRGPGGKLTQTDSTLL
jgi:hypothetical protein